MQTLSSNFEGFSVGNLFNLIWSFQKERTSPIFEKIWIATMNYLSSFIASTFWLQGVTYLGKDSIIDRLILDALRQFQELTTASESRTPCDYKGTVYDCQLEKGVHEEYHSNASYFLKTWRGTFVEKKLPFFQPRHQGTFESKKILTFEYQKRIQNDEGIEGEYYPEIYFAAQALQKFSQYGANYDVKQVSIFFSPGLYLSYYSYLKDYIRIF